MNEEQINKMIEDTYNDSKEDTLRSMLRGFYTRKMLSSVIIVWVYSIIFVALCVFSGIRFFAAGQIRYQIMYAGIFICSVQFIFILKVFAWQIIHRNSIKREIKRLEIRIAELKQAVEGK